VSAHVVLVNPPYPPEAVQSIFLPLGIGYLVAVLEQNGYNVDVVDCQTSSLTQKTIEDKIRSLNPDIIEITSATVTYLPVLDVLKSAKVAAPKALTLMGGPHVTVLDEQAATESRELDITVRGEGEQTMLELAEAGFRWKPQKLESS
jgi:anaerobic magnesium-protoporphyrin IX monomethyl ester cyclase